MNTIHDITHTLNDHQREAVMAELSHLLVLAGAGSGKTRVLVHRIAYLMAAHHVSPHEILAVTFTNKAAAEMRGRIEKLHGVPMNHLWVGTFHGLSHRLLRTHFSEAKLPQTFQILDSDDQLRMIKRIHKSMNLDEKRWQPKQSQWFINNHKENGRRANQVMIERADYTTEQLQQIYIEYETLCERSGLVDFTELLLRSYELLTQHESVREHYQNRFAHILVDEFQDTNTIQYQWLKAFAGKKSFMMAVGDDDQSIYSWRGAQVKNLHHFSRDFKNVQTIRLEQNYRSTRMILDAANAVIAKNKERLGKTLWTESNHGEKISLFEAYHEREEASFVISTIKSLSRNQSLSDFAILYRSNAQSRVLEEALLEAKIPYRIYGGFRFFERAEIKDALAYLRMLMNPHDDTAFERVINTPVRGIGQTTLSKIRDMANQAQTSLWDTTLHCLENDEFPTRTHTALDGFVKLIEGITLAVKPLKLSESIDFMLTQTGLLKTEDKSEKELSRVENLKELISATTDYVVKGEHHLSPIESFLADVALETGEQQAETHTECVSLMTLHAAKGLEFPVVFMVGMEEHLFPHQMSVSERNGLEEERRLCYVGMTRAMQKLYLSAAEYRHLHGQGQYHTLSRFVSEIPTDLIDRVRPKISVSKVNDYSKESTTYFARQSRKPPEKSIKVEQSYGGFTLGQRVTHGKFGRGVIVGAEGSGEATRVQVRFEKAGTKWLVLAFAGLSND